MVIFLLYPQAGNGDTHGVAHPVFAGCLSGLLELALHLCRANFPQKALRLLCGHSCLLCSLGRQEEHAAVSAFVGAGEKAILVLLCPQAFLGRPLQATGYLS